MIIINWNRITGKLNHNIMKIIKSNSILPYVTNKDDILVSRIYRSMVDDSPFILILDRNTIVHNIL